MKNMNADLLFADKLTQTDENNTKKMNLASYSTKSSMNLSENEFSFDICPAENESIAVFRSSQFAMIPGYCSDSYNLARQESASTELSLFALQNDVSRQESYSRLLERGNVETLMKKDIYDVGRMESYSKILERESFAALMQPETYDVSLHELLSLARSKSSNSPKLHPEADAKGYTANKTEENGVPPLVPVQTLELSSDIRSFSSGDQLMDTPILEEKILKKSNGNHVADLLRNSTTAKFVETFQTQNLKTPLCTDFINSKNGKCKSILHGNEAKNSLSSRISSGSSLSQNMTNLWKSTYNGKKKGLTNLSNDTDDDKNNVVKCLTINRYELKETVGKHNKNQPNLLKSNKSTLRNDTKNVSVTTLQEKKSAPLLYSSNIFNLSGPNRENTAHTKRTKEAQSAIYFKKIDQPISKDLCVLHNEMTLVKAENVPKSNCLSQKKINKGEKLSLKNKKPINKVRGRPKRNPSEGWPKRPLSAYNLFFKSEREKILHSLKPLHDKSQVQEDQKWKRKNRSPKHGIISFSDLAKTIGARWKTLHQEEKKKFEMLAAKNMKVYRHEMTQFHEKRKIKR